MNAKGLFRASQVFFLYETDLIKWGGQYAESLIQPIRFVPAVGMVFWMF